MKIIIETFDHSFGITCHEDLVAVNDIMFDYNTLLTGYEDRCFVENRVRISDRANEDRHTILDRNRFIRLIDIIVDVKVGDGEAIEMLLSSVDFDTDKPVTASVTKMLYYGWREIRFYNESAWNDEVEETRRKIEEYEARLRAEEQKDSIDTDKADEDDPFADLDDPLPF